MAKKTTSKSGKSTSVPQVKYEKEEEISPTTTVECYKAMGTVCTGLGKNGTTILDYMDAHQKQALDSYKNYLKAKKEAEIAAASIQTTQQLLAQKKISSAEAQKRITQYQQTVTAQEATAAQYRQQIVDSEKQMVQNILNTPDGWKVLAAAEPHGVKVDWQQMSFAAIDTPECMAFLAKKGYNFEAKQVHFQKEMDFVEYNNNVVAYREKRTVDAYNEVISLVKERNALIRSGKELNDPNTPPARRAELQRTAKRDDARFREINEKLPGLCETVNFQMLKYFDTATLLKEVADKKYVSPARIKAIQLETLEESLANMRGRYQMMKKVNAQFNPQASVEHPETRAAALVVEVESANGLQGALASAGNSAPVRTGIDMDAIATELGEMQLNQNRNLLATQERVDTDATQQNPQRNLLADQERVDATQQDMQLSRNATPVHS